MVRNNLTPIQKYKIVLNSPIQQEIEVMVDSGVDMDVDIIVSDNDVNG